MEELGGECTSHPLLLTVYRLTGVPNTGGSAIVYTIAQVEGVACDSECVFPNTMNFS